MRLYIPRFSEQTTALNTIRFVDRIKTIKEKIEKIPIVGDVIRSTEAAIFPEEIVAEGVVKAAEKSIRELTGFDPGSEFEYGQEELDREATRRYLESRENGRRDGFHDPSNVPVSPAFDSNNGYSAPHYNHAGFVAYAGSNATLVQNA